MRDITILVAVFALAAAALKHPWIGVLGWTWVSIMNPHRLGWGIAYDFQVAGVLAGATLVGLVITRDPRRLPITPATTVLALFALWMLLAWPFSVFPFDDTEMLSRVMKIQFMLFIALALLHTRRQLDLLVWILVLSIGFFGVKGGIFTVLTGGNYRIWGPPSSFIGGNNEVALALVIIIPLMRYLQLQTSQRLVRWGLTAAMLLYRARRDRKPLPRSRAGCGWDGLRALDTHAEQDSLGGVAARRGVRWPVLHAGALA